MDEQYLYVCVCCMRMHTNVCILVFIKYVNMTESDGGIRLQWMDLNLWNI